MSGRPAETFPRPRVVPAFLPVDAPVKTTNELDFTITLSPMIKEGKEDDVKELLDALTSARQMVLWALDRDRTTVSVDDVLSRVQDYARLLRGFKTPPNAKVVEAVVPVGPVVPAVRTDEEDPPQQQSPQDDTHQDVNEDAETVAEATPPPEDDDAPKAAEGAADMSDTTREPKVATPALTLRHAVTFVWRDLLDVKGRDWEAADVAIEEASVLLAAAQALLSRCARRVLTEEGARETHATLRKVAGLLAEARRLSDEAEAFRDSSTPGIEPSSHQHHQDKKSSSWFAGKGGSKGGKTRKTDQAAKEDASKKEDDDDDSHKDNKMAVGPRSSTDLALALPEAWAQLALAEAQTATLWRACSQAHIEWSLIASLCADQTTRYGTNAKGHVEALTKKAPDAANVREWAGKRVALNFLRSHVDMKTAYFSSLARYCVGASLLEQAIQNTDDTQCSSALSELQLALKLHKDAEKACHAFLANARPIIYVDDPTLALAESSDLVKRAYERALQLDASIFHRGPNAETSPFPEPKSLITALPYADPGKSSLWTQQAWDAFDPAKLPSHPTFGHSGKHDCCVVA